MIYITEYPSPVGKLTIASDGINIIGLWIEGQKYFLEGLGNPNTPKEIPVRNDGLSVFNESKKWLDRYFSGKKPKPAELPLAPDGSEFRKLIWKFLCEIPYGETTTYGALAKKAALIMGKKSMSAQAIGGAVGHNPISIIIPCHRVIGTDGSLTGYAGGLDKKIQLLKLEKVKSTPHKERLTPLHAIN